MRLPLTIYACWNFSLAYGTVSDLKNVEVQFLPADGHQHPEAVHAVGETHAENSPPSAANKKPVTRPAHGAHAVHAAHAAHPGHVPHNIPHPHPVHRGGHPAFAVHHEAVPLAQFMGMFPMDIPGGDTSIRVIHLDPSTPHDQIPNIIGDSILESLMSGLSGTFHTQVRPFISAANSVARGYTPHACLRDIERFCVSDHGHDHVHLSPLHCLGLHAGDISAPCSSQISHSVPMVCASEISRFCRQQLDKSVLACLEESAGHNEECMEAVIATKQILAKMSTGNVALVNKRTGEILKSTYNVVSSTMYFAMYALVILIVVVLLYALWMRDDETSIVKSLQRTLRELKMGAKRRKASLHTNMEMKANRSL